MTECSSSLANVVSGAAMLTPQINYEGQISYYSSIGVSCLQFLANSAVRPIAKEEK
jgi:hypothetical protein